LGDARKQTVKRKGEKGAILTKVERRQPQRQLGGEKGKRKKKINECGQRALGGTQESREPFNV